MVINLQNWSSDFGTSVVMMKKAASRYQKAKNSSTWISWKEMEYKVAVSNDWEVGQAPPFVGMTKVKTVQWGMAGTNNTPTRTQTNTDKYTQSQPRTHA